jgi:small conductance mechanosensitive channel
MNDVGGQVNDILLMAQALAVTWGLKVLGAIAVFVIGSIVAGSLRRTVAGAAERTRGDVTLSRFLGSLTYYVVLVVAGVAALGMVGIQMASFIAILATAGLAIGLALQGTLSNVASGVMLLIFRPFRAGDFVDVGGTTGTVESIGLFSTQLNTPDNIHVVVPNSAIYGDTIKNFSHHDTRRIDMVMGISYDDDIALAIETIRAVLEEDERVHENPPYVVAVSELGDSSVDLVVRPWCSRSDYWPLKFDLTRALKERLEAAGCSIPYPQRDVHVHTVG